MPFRRGSRLHRCHGLQTPEDKQSAARVVPYQTNLTESQRTDILNQLK